jgi:hypothetical protein
VPPSWDESGWFAAGKVVRQQPLQLVALRGRELRENPFEVSKGIGADEATCPDDRVDDRRSPSGLGCPMCIQLLAPIFVGRMWPSTGFWSMFTCPKPGFA